MNQTGIGRAWLASLVYSVDGWLRRRLNVQEFSEHPDCILRIELDRLLHTVQLADGTLLQPDDRIINLHIWNERIAALRIERASLNFARRLHRCLAMSLRELAAHISARPQFNDIAAIRARMAFGSTAEQTAQQVRIFGHYGFQRVVADETQSAPHRLHRAGENILISFLLLAGGTEEVRRDVLFRDRVELLMSRETLLGRYLPANSGKLAEPGAELAAEPPGGTAQLSGIAKSAP